MAFWNGSTSVVNINTSTPNSGTGDTLFDAFNKVDNNFANISAQLSSVSQDWLNANVELQLNAGSANITNLYSPSITATNANITGNVTANNIIANVGVYAGGKSFFYGNINVSGNLLPIGSGLNIGTPTNPIGNIYASFQSINNVVNNTSSAGLFLIHANDPATDYQDTGIFGNVYNNYGSNTYAFFGHQYTTNDFAYIITPTNATLGNNIVVGGVYGNTHFGSQFLSNSTVSTSTSSGALIVAGGAGVGGNLNVGGNISVSGSGNLTTAGNIVAAGTVYSGGYPVITPNSPGVGILYNAVSGGYFTQNVAIGIPTPSTSTATGALVVTGGVGVGGNVSALGIVGPYYGQVQTAAQPYITSLGTLTGLTVTGTGTISTGILQANNVGASYSTIGTLNITATVSAPSASVSGNLTAGNVIGNSYGTLYGTVNGTVNGTGVYDYGNRVVSVSSGAGNLTISANAINLTPVGPGAVTVGGNGNIPVITTDAFGRIITAANVTFTVPNSNITLVGTSGSGTLSTGGNLTFASTNGVTIAVGSSYANISTPQDIRTTASPTFANVTAGNVIATTYYGNVIATTGVYSGNVTAGNVIATTHYGNVIGTTGVYSGNVTAGSILVSGNLTVQGTTTTVYNESVTGNITPSANLTYNIGSTTAWWNNIYGTAIHAQYADLAEIYVADADYEPGTVVIFGGDAEITTTNLHCDTRVAGAISTNPAYLMNDAVTGLPVALRGRVPVKLIGPVTKGDSLVTSNTPGYAASVGTVLLGQAVFAKSLTTNLEPGEKIIEAVIL